jgi:hypothetical protein
MAEFRNELVAALAAVGLLAAAGTAGAGTLFVAASGTDGGACGAKTSPCRSISQAITNALAGDSIQVGPGFYGDLNNDGTLGGTGEERGGCSGTCMIEVSKAVRIYSSDGAGATVIRSPGSLN